MARIVIRCRTTGHVVPTGLEADPQSWAERQLGDNRALCPACKVTHAWSKADAWLDGPSPVALQDDAQGAGAAPADLDVVRSARRWMDRHGKAALVKAREMVEAMRRSGDNAGADRWLRIIVAIGELGTPQANA